MRYWFLFCLIAIPLLMRSATPASSRWRVRYRKSLISLRKGMGDDWINNKVLYACIPGTLLVLLFIYVIVGMGIEHSS